MQNPVRLTALWLALPLWGCLSSLPASGAAACPITGGDPFGNYLVPGSIANLKYNGQMALDAYAPAGPRRPAALLLHGSQGDKSTHLTQLFEILDRAGYAWFSLDYRNADDVKAAVAYIRCPGRFAIGKQMIVIAEDSGADIAVRVARGIDASSVVLFGARFEGRPPAPGVPALFFHGSADEESPPAPVEAICREWSSCRFFPVPGGIHNFENWHPDQWDWKQELAAWLRGGRRGLWKDITYSRPDGRDLRMDAFIPEGPGPFAAAVIAHGGGWEAGDKVTYISPILAPLAQAGLAWFSIDYRLIPYVRNPAQLDDLRAAVRYIRSHAERFHIAPGRLALLGESASGQLVSQLASEPCEGCEPQAVVSFYGVYDFTRWDGRPDMKSTLDNLFGHWDTATLKRYSPITYVRRDLPPTLLLQGTRDELYPGTMAYAERLKQSGARYDLVLLEGAPHGMENWAGHAEWQFYKQRVVDWLRTHLAAGK
ncbi:MAG: alpha/beta hydrolase [Bryobacteraceae bacterium]